MKGCIQTTIPQKQQEHIRRFRTQHGIPTQRVHVSAGNGVAFRDESMKLGGLQAARFPNKVHRDGAEVFHNSPARDVVQRRDLHGEFRNIDNIPTRIDGVMEGNAAVGRSRWVLPEVGNQVADGNVF